ncbi:MAG: hypothetical protein ABI533_00020 [Betaproteobacteria bacterium]
MPPVDDDTSPGTAIPAATAFLGLSFVACASMVVGLPPLAGFLAKFTLLNALLEPAVPGLARVATFALLLASGLLSLLALSRAGVRYFWSAPGRDAPRLRVLECAPLALLLGACALLAIRPEPALRYGRDAARGVLRPGDYVAAVLGATPASLPRRAVLGAAPAR